MMPIKPTNATLERFHAMARAGATPETVAGIAKAEGHGGIAIILILRECCGLDLKYAKELSIVALYGSAEEYYKSLSPVMYLIPAVMNLEDRYGVSISDGALEPIQDKVLEQEKQLGRELSEHEIEQFILKALNLVEET